jgi:hypothetical protein
MELAGNDVNHENMTEMKRTIYPKCINVPYFSTLDDEPSDVLHSGRFILPRELGEV